MEESQNKYLIFTVDGRTFAMGFSDVRLIVPAQNACKVPDLPDYVDGTIVNEGKTVTVIDLRKRFGYPDRVTTDRECIIICDTKRVWVCSVIISQDSWKRKTMISSLRRM